MWNFIGHLWNSTQNILPIHWKVFLWNIEILRALRVKSPYAFLKRPTVVRKWWVKSQATVSEFWYIREITKYSIPKVNHHNNLHHSRSIVLQFCKVQQWYFCALHKVSNRYDKLNERDFARLNLEYVSEEIASTSDSGPCFDIKTVFRCMDSLYKDKMDVRLFCFVRPGVRDKHLVSEIDDSQPRHETAFWWRHNGPVT